MYVSDKKNKDKERDKIEKVKRKIFSTTTSEESLSSPNKKKVKLVVDIPNESTTDVENKDKQNLDLNKVKKEDNNEIKMPSDSNETVVNLPLIENGNVT
jgi:hypothetical protein